MEEIEYFYKDNESGKKSRETWLMKNNYLLYEKIINHSKTYNLIDTTFIEKIWYYLNNRKSLVSCHICNKKLKLRNINIGYSKYCSSKCALNDNVVKEKIKQTCLKKYGSNSPLNSTLIKDKIKATNLEKYGSEKIGTVKEIIDKRKETNIEKYGFDNQFKSEIIKDKIKATNIEKYGFNNPSKSEIIKDKRKETNIEKYGFDNQFKSEIIKGKIRLTNLNKYGSEKIGTVKEIIDKRKETELTKLTNSLNYVEYISHEKNIISFKCDLGHNFEIERSLIIQRRRFKTKICTICNPLNSVESQQELNLINFINELNLSIKTNDRKILGGKELDIYIPLHNIAIEFDGLYWHNELHKSNDYHLNKTLECEKQGIQLIHIFEDEWLFKEDIVKSRLKNILGLTPNKIYGRKTIIKEVSSKESKEFLDNNHIQGNVNSSIRLGLYYMDDLVSLMTFGGLRKSMGSNNKEDTYELLRFCNKLDTTVIGGADKLLKYFIRTYQPKEIISYADRRWSQGYLYEKLGFEFVHDSKPNYFYVKQLKRENRFKYRKDVLIKQGFDKNKSEHDIMIDRGIYRIYDCGTKKYSLKIN